MCMNILKQGMQVLLDTIVHFVIKLAQREMPLEFIMYVIITIKSDFCAYLQQAISENLLRTSDGWICTVCQHFTKFKQRAWEHVEAKHMNTGGYICNICQKFCPTASSLRNHNDRHHKIKSQEQNNACMTYSYSGIYILQKGRARGGVGIIFVP